MGFYEDFVQSQMGGGGAQKLDSRAMAQLLGYGMPATGGLENPGQQQQDLSQQISMMPDGSDDKAQKDSEGGSQAAKTAAMNFDPWGMVKANQASAGSPSKGAAVGAGAMRGASIGTAIAPGIGTAVGAIGGALGGLLGLW
jgi:hypothetical protein